LVEALCYKGSNLDEVISFFNTPNPSRRTIAIASVQSLTEMSTRNLPGRKGRSGRKVDNLTAICEPIDKNTWELRRLMTLWAFTACYRDSCTFIC
jgi:thymidylate synthase